MFQFIWLWENMKGVRKRTVLALFLAAIPSIAVIVNPSLIRYVVDNFVTQEGMVPVLHTPAEVLPYLFAMAGIHILRMTLMYLSIILLETSSQTMVINIRQRLFANVMDQELMFFQRYRTGDLMTRFTGDLDMCRHCVSYIIRNLINNILLFFVAFIYLLTVNWRMTLVVIAIMPLIAVLRYFFVKRSRHLFITMREKLSGLNTTAQENIEGNRVVRAFAREDFEIEKFAEKNSEYKDINLRVNINWFKFWPFVEAISQSMSVTIAAVGGIFVVKGMLTIGEMAVFMALGWAISEPMRMLGMLFNDLERFFTSASKVIDLYYAKPTVATRPDSVAPADGIRGEIQLRNVTFGYDSKKPVLKDINLHIAPGETVAIMGSTGSGKTTLLNLIPRFFDVQHGSVLVDGKDVRDYPIPALRQSIGIATQDVFLFSDTVEGNIAYGDIDLPVADVKQFAHMADADSFITHMPDGYDTIIGERGVGLSGGQRQRIALARAMAIRPSILILDDTTSAVDLETEYFIQEQLRSMDYTCTKIIVAQRISSVKDADKIVVLQDSTIAETGTHEELVAQGGYYAEIFRMQNEGV